MATTAGDVRVRRTQEERSATTRAKLLDATVECLVELGYARTTTTLIAERAGVSRGAQLHHYPTKAGLVTAAVEHLADRMGDELKRESAGLPADGDRISAALDVLWSRFSTPLFCAWLELWVAARTDAELRAGLHPVEQRLRRAIQRRIRGLFGDAAASRSGYATAADLTLYVMHGIALERTLNGDDRDDRSRRETALLASWKSVVTDVLDGSLGR